MFFHSSIPLSHSLLSPIFLSHPCYLLILSSPHTQLTTEGFWIPLPSSNDRLNFSPALHGLAIIYMHVSFVCLLKKTAHFSTRILCFFFCP
jgi:hypothetical protein